MLSNTGSEYLDLSTTFRTYGASAALVDLLSIALYTANDFTRSLLISSFDSGTITALFTFASSEKVFIYYSINLNFMASLPPCSKMASDKASIPSAVAFALAIIAFASPSADKIAAYRIPSALLILAYLLPSD